MESSEVWSPTFLDVQPNAEGHFRLYFTSIIARLVCLLEGDDRLMSLVESFPFLMQYRDLVHASQPTDMDAGQQIAWWDDQIAAWECHMAGHLPLRALQEQARLSMADLRVLVAAGIAEEDLRFGALFSALQAPLAARRPCLGMLSWLLGEPNSPSTDVWPGVHTLLELGLLQADNREDTRAELLLRVPPALWDALRGHLPDSPGAGLRWQAPEDFPPLDDLILAADMQDRVAQLPDLLATGQVSAVVVRGMDGSGRRTLLGSVARALGCGVLLCTPTTPGSDTWNLLGPLAALTSALPVIRLDPGPGETVDLPALLSYSGPVGITLGKSGGLQGSMMTSALTLQLHLPDPEARRRYWLAAQVPMDNAVLEEVSARFLLTGGVIHQIAALAHTYARLDGRAALSVADVHQGAQTLNRQALDTLATLLPRASGWGDLIVNGVVDQELRALEIRCSRREDLQTEAGPAFSQSLNRGVRAMFSGPSGTGKTLAARALAASLQMDLYRVDLASVVNKYIGETERNLNQVLARAEELDVILLLDEGDSLMSRRTDVNNSNDRYANLETNYLLQRLETYEGIMLITTNASQRIDSAFLRRLDVIIEFAPPEAEERWLLWHIHLPQTHAVSPGLLEEVAARCAINGGQIRNAALHATLAAMSQNAPVRDAHLEAALQREYRKAGAVYPMRRAPSQPGHLERIQRFASHLE